jgi:hypothetical protein
MSLFALFLSFFSVFQNGNGQMIVSGVSYHIEAEGGKVWKRHRDMIEKFDPTIAERPRT